jgi:hypothetical protein
VFVGLWSCSWRPGDDTWAVDEILRFGAGAVAVRILENTFVYLLNKEDYICEYNMLVGKTINE